MEIKLIGHDCLYQVEQLQQALFGVDAAGSAVSEVRRESDTIFFLTQITVRQPSASGRKQRHSCLLPLPAAELF